MKLNVMVLNAAANFAKILPSGVIQFLYKIPIVARGIRTGLNRFAPQGMTEVEIAAGRNQNKKMRLDLQREKDYWLGTYEVQLQEAIDKLVEPGNIVYDVGANIGFITILFAKIAGPEGHVYAFEALPENAARLKENIELNGFQERVTIIPAAVVDSSGQVDFLLGPSTSMGKVQGSAGRNPGEFETNILVEAVSIDDFISKSGNPAPEVVKIDIEGGEILAMAGMENLLHEFRPILVVEVHGPEAVNVCWEALTAADYSIFHLEEHFPRVNNPQELDWKAYLVAIPNEH